MYMSYYRGGKCRGVSFGESTKKRVTASNGDTVYLGRHTCQCREFLQLSVSTEGERGSAEPLLPLHGRV